MKQLLVRIDDELEREIREMIKRRFGNRRGSLSQLVEQALVHYLHPNSEVTNSTLIEAIDLISDMISEGKSKADILANLEILLDPGFEASVSRGFREWDDNRGIKVPPSMKPSQFLHKKLKVKK